MTKIVTIFLFFLFALVANANEMRTWSTATGKFTTEAEYVGISEDGKTVKIRKKEDSKEIDVPLDKLSKADQEYVSKQVNTTQVKTERIAPKEQPIPSGGVRTWTVTTMRDGRRIDGTYRGEFAGFSDNGKFVRLRITERHMPSGDTIKYPDGIIQPVPLDNFSKEDQKYVAKMMEKKDAPSQQPKTPTATSITPKPEKPVQITNEKEAEQAVLAAIDNDDDRRVVQRFLKGCELTYNKKDNFLFCKWKNIRPKNLKMQNGYGGILIGTVDWTFPGGAYEDWTHLLYFASITINFDHDYVRGYVGFTIWPFNWKFIDSVGVLENGQYKHSFSNVQWKREIKKNGDLEESGGYDFGKLRPEVIDFIAKGKNVTITFVGKSFVGNLPVSNAQGVNATFEMYNVLQKYYKPL